jgi:hypothetical protein
MKLSELINEATDVEIAVVPETNIDGSFSWFVYIVNVGEQIITNVIIQSSGEGEIDAWPVKSSVLKHFMDEILPGKFAKVEMLIDDVFILKNNYWVSFYKGTTIFDKQFFFAPNSISIENCKEILSLNHKGILAR